MAKNFMKNDYLPITRVHCTAGVLWGQTAATDYWLNFNPGKDLMAAASANDILTLPEAGWTATALTNTAGSGSDFGGGIRTPAVVTGPNSKPLGGSYADAGVPNHALTDASGDLLLSPAIFGDAVGMEQAAILAGKSVLPRLLIAEFWGSMSVLTAAEPRSSWGFFEDGCTDSTVEADQYAVIQSGGTGANFLLAGNAATLAQLGTVAAIGTGWHKWKIVLQFNGATGPNVFAYMDGELQNATPGVGLQDEFPLHFGFGALTTNRPLLGAVHVFYDW